MDKATTFAYNIHRQFILRFDMHLTIYFAGSNEKTNDWGSVSPGNVGEDAMVVAGCVHPEVCNSFLFPNLKQFAERFTKKTFSFKNDTLKLREGSPTKFKVGIVKLGLRSDQNEAITGITLCGYSRGGATCFEVARQLYQLAPNIPVEIIADQPIPGALYQGFNTNADSIADCRKLTNLKKVSIILGSQVSTDLPFFGLGMKQIRPKLPLNTKCEILAVPNTDHRPARSHFELQIIKSLYSRGVVTQISVDRLTEDVKELYLGKKRITDDTVIPTPNFPAVKHLQGLFGMKKRQLYQYADKFHPANYLRAGFEWGDQEKLVDWWKKHEKNASRYSTQLTKDLVKKIQQTDERDPIALQELFKEADRWLVLKEGGSSSRYFQVEALRNNIFHKLTTVMGVDKSKLFDIHADVLHKEHYFLNYWNHASRDASFFKTEATHHLDRAFVSHSKGEMTDQQLLAKLDDWLAKKQNSNSKRYNLVVEIREKLQEQIDSPSRKMGF